MEAEDETRAPKSGKGSCSNYTATVHAPIQNVGGSAEIIEEAPGGQAQREEDLILEMPFRAMESSTEDFVRTNMLSTASPTRKRVNFSPILSPSFAKTSGSPGPSLSKGKSSIKSLLPKLSLKHRNPTSADIEKAAILVLGASSVEMREKPTIRRTLSLTKLFSPKMKRTSSLPDLPKKTSSLPVTPIAHSNPESMHGANTNHPLNYTKGTQLPIHRSHSVPVINKDGILTQMDSLGGVYRIIPTTPRMPEETVATSNSNPTADPDGTDDDGEDILEEEAVCRICLIALGEGANTFKMECSCKGELALAHQECAVKWFSIKGNKTCDVCKQEVKNLPVTLLRIQNAQSHNSRGNMAAQEYRFCQDVPVLVIVSMLAYFCFLEQLLVTKMGSGAIAISLPFSCILGLLASMTSTTMVRRRYVWGYATIQFLLVVLFAHIFYSLLHMQAVLSVLLAAFVGFGLIMCVNHFLAEFLRWRRSIASSNQQHSSREVAQADRLSENPHEQQVDPSHCNEVELGNSGTTHGS
ncbi:uncharacterized protein LOC131168600 isoform X1 [Malania oleifera]|uniref:uncharacterized protein LOC131168600 isoform X1 n=1 Tax=Malania oleifera TaxID=397392 RepID=UPI0025AE3BE4|nr:uncharacterized protein LOC131168600 isoform X1 [Malania oleifera]